MKRSKQNSNMWNRNITKMLTEYPQSKDVEQRYVALRHLLAPVYPELKNLDGDRVNSLLKDVVYLDRQLRLYTEGYQEELKQELSAEKIVELKS